MTSGTVRIASVRTEVHRHAALRRFLHPSSVAVVGATTRPGAFGNRVLENMSRFTGRLMPINAKYERIGDHVCYPSLAALPETPDVAVLTVGREAVEPLVLECAERGIAGVIVFASGYTETGKPGRDEAQARLTAIAQRTGLHIVGPNCLGLVNYLNGAAMTFSGLPEQAPPTRPRDRHRQPVRRARFRAGAGGVSRRPHQPRADFRQ